MNKKTCELFKQLTVPWLRQLRKRQEYGIQNHSAYKAKPREGSVWDSEQEWDLGPSGGLK
jgi:hypothetical protein